MTKSYLESFKSMYIYKALLHHGYGAFYLRILEYINILDLDKEKVKNLILEREQFYIDSEKESAPEAQILWHLSII